MPYTHNHDLPTQVKNHLPKHAQDIYRHAFNNAYTQYKNPEKRKDPDQSREAVAHQVAWAAVKEKYYKGEDENWHPKDE